MGRVAVRDRIVTWLQDGNLPHVSTVHPSAPKMLAESEFFASPLFPQGQPGITHGVVVFVHFESQAEKLISYPVVDGGWKMRPFSVVLLCYLRSFAPDVVDAQTANDEFLDGLVARINGAPNLGDASIVFAAGMGDSAGAYDVVVDCDLPKLVNNQAVSLFSTVRFVVNETVQPVGST